MKDITIFLSIMLIGCTSKLSFNPSEMPPAKLHQEYYQEITISGGLVEPVSIDIKPKNTNFRVVPVKENNFNDLIITGTPEVMQDIKIKITASAYTYYTFSHNGGGEHTYIIKVNK